MARAVKKRAGETHGNWQCIRSIKAQHEAEKKRLEADNERLRKHLRETVKTLVRIEEIVDNDTGNGELVQAVRLAILNGKEATNRIVNEEARAQAEVAGDIIDAVLTTK